MNAPLKPRPKAKFSWEDPLLLDQQLSEDERMVREAARAYCQDKLAPRVLEAFRHEKTDPAIFPEMGALGLLGPTIPEQYGGPGTELRQLRPDRPGSGARGLGLPLDDERPVFVGDGSDF